MHTHGAGYCFHKGSPEEVRRHVCKAVARRPAALLSVKLWAYLLGSLLGKAGMDAVAAKTRKLLSSRYWYALNNSIR